MQTTSASSGPNPSSSDPSRNHSLEADRQAGSRDRSRLEKTRESDRKRSSKGDRSSKASKGGNFAAHLMAGGRPTGGRDRSGTGSENGSPREQELQMEDKAEGLKSSLPLESAPWWLPAVAEPTAAATAEMTSHTAHTQAEVQAMADKVLHSFRIGKAQVGSTAHHVAHMELTVDGEPLKVQLLADDNGVSAEFESESGDVRGAHRLADALKQAMDARGLVLESVEVT